MYWVVQQGRRTKEIYLEKVKTPTTKNKRNEAGGIDIIPCALQMFITRSKILYYTYIIYSFQKILKIFEVFSFFNIMENTTIFFLL